MKTKDIKIGAEYAIGTADDIARWPHSVQRARVTEIGVGRRTRGDRFGYGSQRHDGIQIKHLDRRTGEPRNRAAEVVPPVRIQMPWNEFTTLCWNREVAAKKRQKQQDAETQAFREAVMSMLPEGAEEPSINWDSVTFRLTRSRLLSLLTSACARAWERGYTAGHSNAMRRMSDEPKAPTAPNPYYATSSTEEAGR